MESFSEKDRSLEEVREDAYHHGEKEGDGFVLKKSNVKIAIGVGSEHLWGDVQIVSRDRVRSGKGD